MVISFLSDEIRVLVMLSISVCTAPLGGDNLKAAFWQSFDFSIGDCLSVGCGFGKATKGVEMEMADQTIRIIGHSLRQTVKQLVR